VKYIQTGGVKLSVTNQDGREAVVAILGPGDFFGEGCLAGQPVCAIVPTSLLFIKKKEMMRATHGTRFLRLIHLSHADQKHSD
jgi:CRP/FNR family cyclic AMP-dependent transcriptional regulator